MTQAETTIASAVGLPRTGDFDGAALASGREIDPAQWASDDPILGLVREAGYLYGTVRNAEGEMFSIARRIPAQEDVAPDTANGFRSLGSGLILLSTQAVTGESGDTMRFRREAKTAARSNLLERAPRPKGVRFAAPSGELGATQIDLDVDTFAYREEGLVDVGGERNCPALQWYLPGPDSALLYLTQSWEVEGSVLSEQVRGFMSWEEAYMYPGGRLYIAKDPLDNVDYVSWYSGMTRFADGTTELRHFGLGGRSYGWAISSSSTGEVTAGRHVDGVIHLDADGSWHEGIDIDVDGVAWRCEPDPRGHMELGPIANPQQEGRIFRADDTRTPEVHMAWGEIVPARVRAR